MRLVLLLLAGIAPAAAAGLNGQTGTVEWRRPEFGPEFGPEFSIDRPLSQLPPPNVVRRDFTVGAGAQVTDLGFYPSLSLWATDEALVFTFSEGWCCLAAGGDMFVGPVVTFTSQPDDEDMQVTIGDSTIAVTPDDLLVNGNHIAVDLRGRDISGGRLTLLVSPGSNLAERATLALIGIGLIALGSLRRLWPGRPAGSTPTTARQRHRAWPTATDRAGPVR